MRGLRLPNLATFAPLLLIAVAQGCLGSSLFDSLSFQGTQRYCPNNIPGPGCQIGNISVALSSAGGVVSQPITTQVLSTPDGTVVSSLTYSGTAEADFNNSGGSCTNFFGATYTSGPCLNAFVRPRGTPVGDGQGQSLTAMGDANFADSIILNSGVGSGTIQFRVSFYVQIWSQANEGSGTATFEGQTLMLLPFSIGNGSMLFTQTFTDGVPISVSGDVRGNAFEASKAGSPLSGDGGGSLLISSIKVFDANQTQLANFDYFTDSGSAYPFAGGTQVQPTPEPTSVALLLVGLAFISTKCRFGRDN